MTIQDRDNASASPRPELRDIQEISDAMRLGLSGAEAVIMRDHLEAHFANLDSFMGTTGALPDVAAAQRDPGWKATDDNDPIGAWNWRCSIGGGPGVLEGLTVGFKDHTAVAGIPMTFSMDALASFIPDQDAAVVSRVLAAGGIVAGKCNMDNFSSASFGLGGYGQGRRVRNPHAHDHITGGTSSGSAAAVAAGDCDIAIGGDQAGSIRVPASWCGVLGLKPTFGLVSHAGIVSGSEPTIDHAGPFARTSENLARALTAIAGADDADHRTRHVPRELPDYLKALGRDIAGLRVGVLREGISEPVDVGVIKAFWEAMGVLTELGATVVEVSVPQHFDAPAAFEAVTLEGEYILLDSYFAGAFDRVAIDESVVGAMANLLDGDRSSFPLNIRFKLLAAYATRLRYQGQLYARGQNMRASFTANYDAVLAGVDVLAMPTATMAAPRYVEPLTEELVLERTLFGGDDGAKLEAMGRNTLPFNYTGHPALSIPCAKVDGLPVGFQLVAGMFADDVLISFAAAFERAVDWESIIAL
jgi:amidase